MTGWFVILGYLALVLILGPVGLLAALVHIVVLALAVPKGRQDDEDRPPLG